MLKRGTRTCKRIYRGSSRKRLLIRGHRAVFRDPDYELPQLGYEMVTDSDAQWLEVAFISPSTLTGNATDGWTWSNGQHDFALRIEISEDLLTWTNAEVEDAAGSPATVTGGYEYTARTLIPCRWNSVMVDLTISSERGLKSITALSAINAAISLPGYPYSMPADAADLQADLRTAGFTGATVAIVSRALTASILNHTAGGQFLLQSTVVSAAVTQVRAYISGSWTAISLPGYPYELPADQADLQADLRTAGYTGAVVSLMGDKWTIVLPNVIAQAADRNITASISPDDPYPGWDAFGIYVGILPATGVTGGSSNVRTPGGAPLLERPRQFARLRVTRSDP